MEKIGEEKQEQSFLEHLEVLRWHLIRSSAAKCCASAAEPPLPHNINLLPF